MTRARHASEAKKPYADFAAPSASARAKLDPKRPRRIFPVEDW
jgi:putative transposase